MNKTPEKVGITAVRGALPELRKSGKVDGSNSTSGGLGLSSREDKNGNINGLLSLESFKSTTSFKVSSSDNCGHGKVDLTVDVSQTESIPIQPSETKTGRSQYISSMLYTTWSLSLVV